MNMSRVYAGLDLQANFKVYKGRQGVTHDDRSRQDQLLRLLRRTDPAGRDVLRLLPQNVDPCD
jgi:hypothetical protein